jgi:hypothetical protein
VPVLPRATRNIGGSVRGSNHHPRRVAGAARRFNPSAQQPRPLSCPLNPLPGNPSIRPRRLDRHGLYSTGRGRRCNQDERVRGLRGIGGERERAATGDRRQPQRDQT